METDIKRTSILDIINNNAEVYFPVKNPAFYEEEYEIKKGEIVSVLVNTNGEIGRYSVILQREGATDTLFCKNICSVYASKQDLLNRLPLSDKVDLNWLREKYELKRPIYYIDHENRIASNVHEMRIDHINLVTDEVTYRWDMDGYFFTEEELKASRPDLFPPKTKVRVTKTYELEADKEDAEILVNDPSGFHPYIDKEVSTTAEIID